MAVSLYQLQKGIYDKLKADATLTALLGASRVYDHPPDGAAYPYVTIGDKTGVDDGTKTYKGMEATVTIHSWSQQKSSAQVQQIMDRLYALLHEESLPMTGQTLILMRCEFSHPELDVDGRTHHGIQRFRILFKEG